MIELAIIVSLGITGAIIKGMVLSYFWKWFIVATFDWPLLNFHSAIGIVLLLEIFFIDTKDKDTKLVDDCYCLIAEIIAILLCFLVGWIIHLL